MGVLSLHEVKAICQMREMEDAAAINVSMATYGTQYLCVGSSYLNPDYQTEVAAAIKKAVHIPLLPWAATQPLRPPRRCCRTAAARAAWIPAARGHQVELAEKKDYLGG